jgi:hypothetical protein
MGIEQLLDPFSDFGECDMEPANDVILHVHSCTLNTEAEQARAASIANRSEDLSQADCYAA